MPALQGILFSVLFMWAVVGTRVSNPELCPLGLVTCTYNEDTALDSKKLYSEQKWKTTGQHKEAMVAQGYSATVMFSVVGSDHSKTAT